MGHTISYTMFQIHFLHTNTNPRRGAHHGPVLERARPVEHVHWLAMALYLNGVVAVADSG
jgi:hypothetical protein